MRDSVVSIESVSNNSFGTGFVIDSDEKGVYILTCQHVLDDVVTPVVENVLAKVIAKGGFIDMAVLYVSKLHLKSLPLQTQECDKLAVEVVGFSSFSQNLTQKKHIKATLYQELIELHSKEEDDYYTVRKIRADDGFNFDRGNSGSPVICKNSGNVIAMISNKEGNDIGYAIDIANLKEVWRDAPERLFTKPKAKIEPVSGTKKESATKLKEDVITETSKKSNASSVKYLIALVIILGVGFGMYSMFSSDNTEDKDKITQEERDRAKRQREMEAQEEARKRAEEEAKKREEEKLSRFNLILNSIGENKINVIKAIIKTTGFSLRKSKELTENLPKTIQRNLSKEKLEELKKELDLCGASYRVERVDKRLTMFKFVLRNAGVKRINVIKAIRSATGFGLKESKELTENLPKTIQLKLSKEGVEELKKALELSGASYNIAKI